MRDLRVLVVSERYWPEGSGGELATYLVTRVLSKKFKVAVVTGLNNPYRLNDVKYVYEPLLSRWEKPLLWLNTFKLARREEFKKLFREADIVYVPRFAFPVIPYAKKMGKKVIVHLHDYIPVSYTAVLLAPYEEHKDSITRKDIALECGKGLKYCVAISLFWWLPKLARRWISQADKIICVSKRQAEIISDQAPELRNKIEVVYNPLPQELLSGEPSKELSETPTFLYVSGDTYVKGFHILLQTLKKLGKLGVKAEFILMNTYSPRSLEELRKLEERYRNIRVQVIGRVKYETLTKLHGRSWALVFPSILEEPLPYAVAEATVLATIPIFSKVGGVVELLSDTIASEFAFTPNSSSELAERLEYLCSLNVNEVKTIGYKLRNEVYKKFSSFRVEERILEIFTYTAEGESK